MNPGSVGVARIPFKYFRAVSSPCSYSSLAPHIWVVTVKPLICLARVTIQEVRTLRSSRGLAGYFFAPAERLWATAARIKSFKSEAAISSPPPKSIARVLLASRPALKSPFGSFKDAPLKKLSFT